MTKLFKLLFSRLVIVGILIILQAFILITLISEINQYSRYINVILYLISIIMVIYLINKESSPSMKLPWITLIILFPVFGGLFYFFFGNNKMRRKFVKNANGQQYKLHEIQVSNKDTLQKLLDSDKRMYQESSYILKASKMPIYDNTENTYLESGEKYYKYLLEELKKAEKFIFLEYFIIAKGEMWNNILEILKQKVSQGVEVRVMYDDMGTISTLPYGYQKKLEKLGIKCVIFNPFVPILSLRHNNRDHKKITVIDGNVGFTGGINLADEYINKKLRFGHWKDTGIMIKGEGVRNLCLMFLDSWHYYKNAEEDYNKYMPQDIDNYVGNGFTQAYIDFPNDGELVGRNVYINMLNDATDYAYITTPYLIMDNELTTALILASKRGVDIRIITPHIPDKWYVHIVTQSYYAFLIENGIKIYEYTPGFIHSKTFVADDKIGTVSTINFDYRSLYHNYECGVWMYNSSSILDIKKDFENTKNISMEITDEWIKSQSFIKNIISQIFRFFAPML